MGSNLGGDLHAGITVWRFPEAARSSFQRSSALLPESSTEGDRGFRDRAPQDPSSRPFWRVHRFSRQLLVACARGGARWTPCARRGVQE